MEEKRWIDCAAENGQCDFKGTQLVRYGSSSSANPYKTALHTDGVTCSNDVFGDPALGDVNKRCAHQIITTGTYSDVASGEPCVR